MQAETAEEEETMMPETLPEEGERVRIRVRDTRTPSYSEYLAEPCGTPGLAVTTISGGHEGICIIYIRPGLIVLGGFPNVQRAHEAAEYLGTLADWTSDNDTLIAHFGGPGGFSNHLGTTPWSPYRPRGIPARPTDTADVY